MSTAVLAEAPAGVVRPVASGAVLAEALAAAAVDPKLVRVLGGLAALARRH